MKVLKNEIHFCHNDAVKAVMNITVVIITTLSLLELSSSIAYLCPRSHSTSSWVKSLVSLPEQLCPRRFYRPRRVIEDAVVQRYKQ